MKTDFYITGEELAENRLSKTTSEHRQWIKNNIHLLSDTDRFTFEKAISAKTVGIKNYLVHLEGLRLLYDDVYRHQQNAKRLAKAVDDLTMPKPRPAPLKTELTDKYKGQDIWISPRHLHND
jgi:hypothetical protein